MIPPYVKTRKEERYGALNASGIDALMWVHCLQNLESAKFFSKSHESSQAKEQNQGYYVSTYRTRDKNKVLHIFEEI